MRARLDPANPTGVLAYNDRLSLQGHGSSSRKTFPRLMRALALLVVLCRAFTASADWINPGGAETSPNDEKGRAQATVGFIADQKAVPVIDFRYLGAPCTAWYTISPLSGRNL